MMMCGGFTPSCVPLIDARLACARRASFFMQMPMCVETYHLVQAYKCREIAHLLAKFLVKHVDNEKKTLFLSFQK